MKLGYAMLAEAVERFKDGRVCIFGGDFDTFVVDEIPSTIAFLVTVKVNLEEGEGLSDHTLALELSTPDNRRVAITEPRALPFHRSDDLPASFPIGTNLVFRAAVKFTLEGAYFIHVVADGNPVTDLPLRIKIGERGDTA